MSGMTEHRVYTTPLPKKLGITEDAPIALLAAPPEFKSVLGELPVGVTFASRFTSSTKLGLCFVRSREDLDATVEIIVSQMPQKASAWIIYPKRAGNYKTDFNENHVRNRALQSHLVDFKVCSVDSNWSGLKFAHRKR
ncbi:MAG TPA: hypothetical protein VF214_05710 [Edaphobacter sp.]